MLSFAAEAWAIASESTVARSFRGCGMCSTLDHSKEGDVPDHQETGTEFKQNFANFFRDWPEES